MFFLIWDMPGHAREISEKYSEKRRTFSENQGFPIWHKPGTSHAQARDKPCTNLWTVCVILRVILHNGSTASSGVKFEVRVTFEFWQILCDFLFGILIILREFMKNAE